MSRLPTRCGPSLQSFSRLDGFIEEDVVLLLLFFDVPTRGVSDSSAARSGATDPRRSLTKIRTIGQAGLPAVPRQRAEKIPIFGQARPTIVTKSDKIRIFGQATPRTGRRRTAQESQFLVRLQRPTPDVALFFVERFLATKVLFEVVGLF